jgi:hypothetical protein
MSILEATKHLEIEYTKTTVNEYGLTTVTKYKTNLKMGKYQPTSKDEAKKQADIRLMYCNGGSFTVASKIELSGRGIKKHNNGYYEVTEKALEKLQKQYSWATDF